MMKKQHVKLSDTDREFLETLISKGELIAKAYRRALGLLELDRGQTSYGLKTPSVVFYSLKSIFVAYFYADEVFKPNAIKNLIRIIIGKLDCTDNC